MPGNGGEEERRVGLRGRQAADIRLGLEESLLAVGNDEGANLERGRRLRAVILLRFGTAGRLGLSHGASHGGAGERGTGQGEQERNGDDAFSELGRAVHDGRASVCMMREKRGKSQGGRRWERQGMVAEGEGKRVA